MPRQQPPRDSEPRDDEFAERPSKSALKRAAQDAQALGEQLTALPESRLRELPLDEALLDAILLAREIKARGGRARQLQYIGKLMRDRDVAPILDALAEPARQRALATERDRRLTIWRDRLLQEGPDALAALREWRPDGDYTLLAQTLDRARDPRVPEAQQLGARRELFRLLRTLFAG
jgi:ribosome-associated protein